MINTLHPGALAAEIDRLPTSRWLLAGGLVVGGMVAAVLVSRLFRRVMGGRDGDRFAGVMAGRVLGYATFLLALLTALNVLEVRVLPLLGALGVGGILLALALQKSAENLIAGIVLHARRPFAVGDSVELNGITGRVLDIDARTTVLRRPDGVVVRIPNIDVVTYPIVTLTRDPSRRSEVVVGVAYDTDLDTAYHVLVDAVSHLDRVAADPPPVALLTAFGASSIEIVVQYWHASDIPSELAARHDVILAIHRALAAAQITIPFAQMVLWSPEQQGSAPYSKIEPHVRADLPLRTAVRASRPSKSSGRLWLRRHGN